MHNSTYRDNIGPFVGILVLPAGAYIKILDWTFFVLTYARLGAETGGTGAALVDVSIHNAPIPRAPIGYIELVHKY